MVGRVIHFVVSHLSPIGGLEVASTRLANVLQQDWPVRMVALSGSEVDHVEANILGVNEFEVAGPSLRKWSRLGTLRAARRVLSDTAADDVIVASGLWAALPLLAVASRKQAARIFVVEHSLMPGRSEQSVKLRVLNSVAAWLYRRAATIVGVSPVVAHYVQDLTRREVQFIPNVVTVPERLTVAERRAAELPIVAVVGGLRAVKRVSVAIEAMHDLPKYELHIIGDGEERASLERLATTLGVADRVRFHGAVPPSEVADHLARASVLLHPSASETFGLVYFEAAAAGVPVVSATHPVSQWLVPRYAPGLLYDNPMHIPELVRTAHGQSVEQEQFAQARDRVATEFSEQAVADRWRHVINELVGDDCHAGMAARAGTEDNSSE